MTEELTYTRFSKLIRPGYETFLLDPRRFRSYRLHLGEEVLIDEDETNHHFDVIWFEGTLELIAAEVEESYGVILPLNFKLRKSTNRFAFLGSFTEQGINELLPYQGGIIRHLWEKWWADWRERTEERVG